MENLTSQLCPLCGASNSEPVIELGKYTILRCKSCTNAWTFPPCSPQDYESEFFGKDNVASANRKVRRSLAELPRYHQKMLSWMLRICLDLCPTGGRVLDIGCGDGLFIEMLTQRGFACQGIEPSLEATQLATAAGLPVVRGYFPHPDIRGPFDLVIMSHVLEHIAEPRQTLRQLLPMAPGGHLVLAQTNYRGIIPRTFGQRWYAWCPEGHFYHFTPKGLRRLLGGLGYRVERVQPVSLVHMSRRHRYFLPILDMIPNLCDQFIMAARIPGDGE